jgi:hypothetical protein
MKRLIFPLIIFLLLFEPAMANKLLIEMDENQSNHLKAYGFIFNYLKKEEKEVKWLLNYKGGSFLVDYDPNHIISLLSKSINYQIISDSQANQLLDILSSNTQNTSVGILTKVPKIALYSPKSASPWDDAVSLSLNYAEIPYDVIYDKEILDGKLSEYDWVHLHHEDFTGQMGKMYSQKDQIWYQKQLKEDKDLAQLYGFKKVSQMKMKIATTIKNYVLGGGYLFAMCTATDTFDIALALDSQDACESFYDGDPIDPNFKEHLKFENTLAFNEFSIITNYRVNEFSDIDSSPNYSPRVLNEELDFFELNEFSANTDLIPTMLTQNHEKVIHGFMGQTTAFASQFIKSDVIILAENQSIKEVKYLYGQRGKGFFTFLGGHDPEDYQHLVNEEHTDLTLHKNSPGYRLILNNVLFPSAKKKKQKT